jgi:hypothetical protein
MTNIEHELARIAVELRRATSPEIYAQLYAAQQALSWATFPEGFMSPYGAILGGKVVPLTHRTPADSEDCSVTPHRLQS